VCDWFWGTGDVAQWRAVTDAAIKPLGRSLLTSLETISFSRSTLMPGVSVLSHGSVWKENLRKYRTLSGSSHGNRQRTCRARTWVGNAFLLGVGREEAKWFELSPQHMWFGFHCYNTSGLHTLQGKFSLRLTLWSRSSSKYSLRIQSVPRREHHTSPLHRRNA
jgi:hypothetical protein